jgi:hypothetical protein
MAADPAPTPGMHRWQWERFLKDLDKAGYAVVRKPVLDGRGLNAAQKARREGRA